jgi:predicted CoA-binding protein
VTCAKNNWFNGLSFVAQNRSAFFMKEKKRTLVLGASPKPHRYSNMAANSLIKHGHEVVLIGFREAEMNGVPIQKEWPENLLVDTITLYLSAANQRPYYEKIVGSGALRVIFNPGTENPELEKLAKDAGFEVEIACTLVLLGTGQY